MKITKTKQTLFAELADVRKAGAKIVLVPTMGALHEGHLDLVRKGKVAGDVVVCSIFVNPTQFNDPEDLLKYPRPLAKDIRLLESVGCDVLFLPAVEEMYGEEEQWNIDLGTLDQVLEGRHRPGHFQGVTQIVYKLFVAVEPDIAIFGQKDLQQFQVVQRMVGLKRLPVELMMAPIVREPDGLAMSSRNVRLSATGRQQALAVFETLNAVRERFQTLRQRNVKSVSLMGEARQDEPSLHTLTEWAEDRLRKAEGVTPEYFAICHLDTLIEADRPDPKDDLVALVAVWVDGVRLIDNMLLTGN